MSTDKSLISNTDNEKSSAFVVATIIQIEAPTSGQVGDKAIVCGGKITNGWVGGGCVQPAVIKAASTVLQQDEPQLIRVAPDGAWQPIDGVAEYTSHCLGGGSVLLFMEPHNNNPTLHIVGSSSIANCLALMSTQMNLNVALIGGDLVSDSCTSHIQQTDAINASHNDYIVIATQGKGDLAAIEAALATDCRYIRMVVSYKKLAGLKAKLAANDVSPVNIDRLCGPAGLDIDAKLPAEVAVSVLAEIIKTRRTKHKNELSSGVSIVSDDGCDAIQLGDGVKRESEINKSSGGCCG